MMGIFSRFKTVRGNSGEADSGKIYALWKLALPVVLGFAFGRLADAGLGYGLELLAGDNGMTNSAVTGGHAEEISVNDRRGLDGFLASNPFRVSPRKPDTPAAPPPPKTDDTPKPPDTTLDDVILRGTLPGIGAWVDVKNELKLVLIGRNIDTYKLIAVNYGDIMLRKGNENPVTKYIIYGPSPAAEKKPEAPKTAPAPRAAAPAPEPPKQTGNIVAAVPGSQEGQIPSELVSNLVQNPFDELKRIRLRPNDKAGGLEVQWIQNDSLLKRLGVQRGDVIRSVNGIPFTNMGDIANSMNSLITSERFDVEVTRGGENTALRDVVK